MADQQETENSVEKRMDNYSDVKINIIETGINDDKSRKNETGVKDGKSKNLDTGNSSTIKFTDKIRDILGGVLARTKNGINGKNVDGKNKNDKNQKNISEK